MPKGIVGFQKGNTYWKQNVGKCNVVVGEKHHNWKGEDAGYVSMHHWIYRNLGKADKCCDCCSLKTVQWANISGKYSRNINDWKKLCCVCHRKFDGITKLTKKQAIEIRKMYFIDKIYQREIAKLFNVDQGTISKLVTGKTQYYL